MGKKPPRTQGGGVDTGHRVPSALGMWRRGGNAGGPRCEPPSILPRQPGRGGGAVPGHPRHSPLPAGVPARQPRPPPHHSGWGEAAGGVGAPLMVCLCPPLPSPPLLPGVQGRYRCSPAGPPGTSSGASSGASSRQPPLPGRGGGGSLPGKAPRLLWVGFGIYVYIVFFSSPFPLLQSSEQAPH